MSLGLSPPVRGNPVNTVTGFVGIGSIPARAGEPERHTTARSQAGVYPRPCGGTEPRCRRRMPPGGLSPPVRGNRCVHLPDVSNEGSIPARAGEPDPANVHRVLKRVYPRPCGGTSTPRYRFRTLLGLSPPVRGNHSVIVLPLRLQGSIPARAGEPCVFDECTDGYRVYPRPCGGTESSIRFETLISGLSPPVRGNLYDCCHGLLPLGSIPARAGEPMDFMASRPSSWVYPRPCGGTSLMLAEATTERGLSPPVRGNRPTQSFA